MSKTACINPKLAIFIANVFHTIAEASSIIFYLRRQFFCWRKNFWSRKADTFLKVLIKRNWHFQRITAKRYKFFQGKFSEIILLSCSDVKLFSKSLLIGISANSAFRTVFDFKKLKIIHCWNIYHFLLWLQASAFLK